MKPYLAVPVLALLVACGASNSEPANDASPTSETADVYGVDGMETVGEVTFLPASSIYNAYARGDQFCYDYQTSDETCRHVEAKQSVTRDAVNGWSIWREVGGGTKVLTSFQTVVKGKFLCTQITEDSLKARTAYRSYDNKAKIISTDVALTPAEHSEWHERIVRNSRNEIGSEVCYRYSVVTRSPDGTADILREHRFMDGVEQVAPDPVFVKMFTAKSDLFLRPLEE